MTHLEAFVDQNSEYTVPLALRFEGNPLAGRAEVQTGWLSARMTSSLIWAHPAVDHPTLYRNRKSTTTGLTLQSENYTHNSRLTILLRGSVVLCYAITGGIILVGLVSAVLTEQSTHMAFVVVLS